jgi:hypothetical protein
MGCNSESASIIFRNFRLFDPFQSKQFMKRITGLTLIVLLAFSFFACNSKKSGLFIPDNALMVVHVNPSSLSSKITWDEIKNSEWFKDLRHREDDTLVQKILDNPEAVGMDTKGDFFAFVARSGNNAYTVFEGLIKDASAFEVLNKKIHEKGKVESDAGYSMMVMDNSTMVAWNKEKFAYINDMPEMSSRSPFGNRRMGDNNNKLNADSLRRIVKAILNHEGKNMHDDKRFAGLMKEKGDMHMWFNSSANISDIAGGFMDMMKVSSLLEGNATGAVLSFDDGKITINSKSFVNDELAKLMEKYDSKDISADVLNRIPSQNVVGVMAANMNPKMIQEVLKAAGFEGLLNSFLSKQGLSVNEIFSAINGEFIVAVSDLQKKDTTITYPAYGNQPPRTRTKTNTDFDVLLALGVGQQPSFEKILNFATTKMGVPSFPYKFSKEWFVAGKKEATVNAFLSGTSTNQPWVDKIKGHPFGLYINLQKIIASQRGKDSMVNSITADLGQMWEDIVATGGEFKNGVVTAEFVINLVDKKTNSLKQLNAFANRANEAQKKMMDRFMKMEMDDMPGMGKDSFKMVLPPPPAEDIEQ